jgi:hypothetical protein
MTALALKPFAWLDRHVPAVRRHGYLIATVGVRRQSLADVSVFDQTQAASSP